MKERDPHPKLLAAAFHREVPLLFKLPSISTKRKKEKRNTLNNNTNSVIIPLQLSPSVWDSQRKVCVHFKNIHTAATEISTQMKGFPLISKAAQKNLIFRSQELIQPSHTPWITAFVIGKVKCATPVESTAFMWWLWVHTHFSCPALL